MRRRERHRGVRGRFRELVIRLVIQLVMQLVIQLVIHFPDCRHTQKRRFSTKKGRSLAEKRQKGAAVLKVDN